MAKFWEWVNNVANRQPMTGDETLYADAVKNQEARNTSKNQYAAAAAAAKSGNANSSSLQGTIDPDRTGAAAAPKKGLYDQTGMDATAAVSADAALTGALAGAGALPKTKPSSNLTGTEATPSTPTQPSTTQPGTSGGDKVTYIDANGDAQKGTTTPSQAASDPQQSYLDALREQYQKAYEDAVRASDALRDRDKQAYEDAVKANDALLGQYQKMYDDAVKANNDAAKAAAERALAQVEQGIGELGEQYGGINKQLYRDYMESLRVLPQELAARGYNGGMSESARLGLDTAYGERLNENEAARIAAIMQLRQQGADAEYQANAARDQANAEAQQNLYAAAAAREQANAEAQQNLYAAAVARDQANAEAQQNLYANFINLLLQQQQDAATKAQNMAQYGDFSGYLGLGYSQSQIDAMKKAWIAANPEMAQELGFVKAPETASGSSGSSGSYNGSNSGSGSNRGKDIASYYDKVNDLLANGATLAEIQAALAKEATVNKSLTEDQAGDVMLYANYAKRIAPTIGDKNPSLDSFNQYRKQYI